MWRCLLVQLLRTHARPLTAAASGSCLLPKVNQSPRVIAFITLNPAQISSWDEKIELSLITSLKKKSFSKDSFKPAITNVHLFMKLCSKNSSFLELNIYKRVNIFHVKNVKYPFFLTNTKSKHLEYVLLQNIQLCYRLILRWNRYMKNFYTAYSYAFCMNLYSHNNPKFYWTFSPPSCEFYCVL